MEYGFSKESDCLSRLSAAQRERITDKLACLVAMGIDDETLSLGTAWAVNWYEDFATKISEATMPTKAVIKETIQIANFTSSCRTEGLLIDDSIDARLTNQVAGNLFLLTIDNMLEFRDLMHESPN